jgi:O-antigen/teichoic acid export membrane protein
MVTAISVSASAIITPGLSLRVAMRGSFWSVLPSVLRLAISFACVPLTITRIGADRYGLWMLALSVSSVISFLDAGLTPVLLNRLTESNARGDAIAFRKYVHSAATTSVCLILLSFVAAAFGAVVNWAAIAKVTDPVAFRECRSLFAVVFFFDTLALALGPVESILFARLEMVRPKIYGLGASLASSGLLLIGLWWNVALPILAGLTCAPLALYRLLLLPALGRHRIRFRPNWHEFSCTVRELLPSCMLFIVIQVGTVAIGCLPNLFVARCYGLTDVAVFSLSTRLVGLPISVVAAALPTFWVGFTIAWQQGNKMKIRRWLTYACGLTGLALVTYAVVMSLVGPRFLSYWTHGRLYPDALLILALGCGATVQGIINWLSTFLHSISDLRFEAICCVSAAALTAASSAVGARTGNVALFAFAVVIALVLASLFPMLARVRTWLSLPGDRASVSIQPLT